MKQLKLFKAALQKYKLAEPVPPPIQKEIRKRSKETLKNILKEDTETFKQYERGEFIHSLKALFQQPVTMGAFSLAVFIIAILFFDPLTLFRKKEVYFTVKGDTNDVLINNRAAFKGVIKNNTLIKTKEKGAISLHYKKIAQVSLSSNSELLVKKISFKKESERYTMQFNLNRGSIKGNFSFKAKIYYSFETPQARIFSGGTQFTISVSKSGTRVRVSKGRLTVYSKITKKTFTAKPGKDHTIEENKQKTIKKVKKTKIKKKKTKYEYLKIQ